MDFKREKVSGTEHEYLTTFFTQEEICKALDTAYLKSQHFAQRKTSNVR